MLPPLIERKALDEVLKLFGPGLPVEDEASLPPEPFIPSSVELILIFPPFIVIFCASIPS